MHKKCNASFPLTRYVQFLRGHPSDSLAENLGSLHSPEDFVQGRVGGTYCPYFSRLGNRSKGRTSPVSSKWATRVRMSSGTTLVTPCSESIPA